MAEENDGGGNGKKIEVETSTTNNVQPGPVPYERFKEINDELRQAQETLKALTDAQATAEEEKLKEQQKFQQLYEKAQAELQTERTERMRMQVAVEAKIPLGMAGRLQGTTREEMLQDAKGLAAFLKPPTGPGNPPPPGGGNGTPLDIEAMSPEEIRKNAGRLWGHS